MWSLMHLSEPQKDSHFTVQVTNRNSGNGITYFSGKIWKEFARVYQMEADHHMYFTKDEGGVFTKVIS
jgi:hypothetical protein